MKHMKILGSLAVAAMAIAAFVGTATASAASFTASATGATITEQTLENHVFSITGSNTQCTTIAFAGVTEGSASGGLGFTTQSQKVTPTYSGCTAFGFAATVTNNGCYYTLSANGQVDVVPTSGGSCNLTITVNNFFAKCKVVVGNQSIPGANSFATNGNHIDVTINASKIDAQVTESSGLCPLTTGTHNDAATYKGKSTVGATGAQVAFDA